MISTAYSRRRRRSASSAGRMGDLDGQPGPLEPLVADQRARLGQRWRTPLAVGLLGQALDAQHDLHLDRRRALELLVDVPAAIGGLAPRRPVERDVGDDPRRLALAGQAVARLPREVAEQHVDLEVLLERLTLEERRPRTRRAAR